MRRLIIYLLIATITFLVGLGGARLMRATRATPKSDQPLPVTFCELERSPEQYEGRVIRISTILYGDAGDAYIHEESCGPQDGHTPPMIKVYDDGSFVSVVPDWARFTPHCGSAITRTDQGLGADVTIVGGFEADSLLSKDDVKVRRFRIVPRSVIQLFPPTRRH